MNLLVLLDGAAAIFGIGILAHVVSSVLIGLSLGSVARINRAAAAALAVLVPGLGAIALGILAIVRLGSDGGAPRSTIASPPVVGPGPTTPWGAVNQYPPQAGWGDPSAPFGSAEPAAGSWQETPPTPGYSPGGWSIRRAWGVIPGLVVVALLTGAAVLPWVRIRVSGVAGIPIDLGVLTALLIPLALLALGAVACSIRGASRASAALFAIVGGICFFLVVSVGILLQSIRAFIDSLEMNSVAALADGLQLDIGEITAFIEENIGDATLPVTVDQVLSAQLSGEMLTLGVGYAVAVVAVVATLAWSFVQALLGHRRANASR